MIPSFNDAQFQSIFDMPVAGDDLSCYFTDLIDDEPVELEAPQEDMVNTGKRGAEWMVGAAGEGGSKRQRSPTGSPWSTDEDNELTPDQAVAAPAPAREGGSGTRRLWVKERDCEWWDRVSDPLYPEAEFKSAFRMSRATFAIVCDELGAAVAKEDTMLRAAIPVRKRVAVCIWRLATGEPLRMVSKRFGIGISTCHKLVLEVSAAIKSLLMPKVVVWPEGPAAASVAAKFEAASGIPGVVGAVYTTHIPIIAPKTNVAAYYNRRHTERNQKTSYSVTVQGVVDADGAFTDTCIGWHGSLSDEDVLLKSALNAQHGAARLLPSQGQWLLGGGGYPLMDWMLVPYTQRNPTWPQHVFNEKAAVVRDVARGAFARLKARWGCLQKRTEVKVQDLPVVLGACCVLHNICERSGDAFDPELKFELVDDEMVAENPVRSAAAAHARDAIAHNLLHHGAAAAAAAVNPFF